VDTLVDTLGCNTLRPNATGRVTLGMNFSRCAVARRFARGFSVSDGQP